MSAANAEGLEKSATLLLSLGEDDAAAVLRHLGPREVQKLGEAMAALKSVPRERVEEVLEPRGGDLVAARAAAPAGERGAG
ncbi:MAG: hypothetical protein OHK0026_14280 [Rhodocyclaceae bacterium]